ncbi:MAG: hypothetical protein ACRDH0_08295 [Actinomycetota bacterium]
MRTVGAGCLAALVLLLITDSPVWLFVFLGLAVVIAIALPAEEIRDSLAWQKRSLPLPSLRYWVMFGIGHVAFVGWLAGTIFDSSLLAVAGAATFIVSFFARMRVRGVQIRRSLGPLPQAPAPSSWYWALLGVGSAGFFVMLFGALLGYRTASLVAGVVCVLSLGVQIIVRDLQVRRFFWKVLLAHTVSARPGRSPSSDERNAR